MSVDQSRPQRKGRRPFAGRLSVGHIIVLVAGLLALLANFAVLRARDDTYRVAVAERDLAAGTVLDEGAFRLVNVSVDPEILVTLISEEGMPALDGRIVTRSIVAGDLVARSDLTSAAAPMEKRAMSIPIDRVHAVGGEISTSDVVDVIAVSDGVAEFILLAAPVLDVADSSSAGLGSSGKYFVTLAVDSHSALRIASAMDLGTIEIVRATGATEPTDLVFPKLADGGDVDAGS